MDDQAIVKELSELVQLDVDAVHAYDSAIAQVDVLEIREQLSQFRADHHRHILDLSAVITRFGGKAPRYSPDVKGFVLQGFTALRAATGTEGALKAMKTNEELTNRTYAKAQQLDVPNDVKTILQRNFSDEQRHLRMIEQWLAARAWETAGAHP